MMDSQMEYIEEHKLRVVQSKVEEHKGYGYQVVIIIQPGDKE